MTRILVGRRTERISSTGAWLKATRTSRRTKSSTPFLAGAARRPLSPMAPRRLVAGRYPDRVDPVARLLRVRHQDGSRGRNRKRAPPSARWKGLPSVCDLVARRRTDRLHVHLLRPGDRWRDRRLQRRNRAGARRRWVRPQQVLPRPILAPFRHRAPARSLEGSILMLTFDLAARGDHKSGVRARRRPRAGPLPDRGHERICSIASMIQVAAQATSKPGSTWDTTTPYSEATSASPTAAWPAASRAVSTRSGEQLT
jgi:hypothetical protein